MQRARIRVIPMVDSDSDEVVTSEPEAAVIQRRSLLSANDEVPAPQASTSQSGAPNADSSHFELFKATHGVTKTTKQPCKLCISDRRCRWAGKGMRGHK